MHTHSKSILALYALFTTTISLVLSAPLPPNADMMAFSTQDTPKLLHMEPLNVISTLTTITPAAHNNNLKNSPIQGRDWGRSIKDVPRARRISGAPDPDSQLLDKRTDTPQDSSGTTNSQTNSGSSIPSQQPGADWVEAVGDVVDEAKSGLSNYMDDTGPLGIGVLWGLTSLAVHRLLTATDPPGV